MKPWIRKYQPKSLKDVKGQDSAVKQLEDFVTNFKKQKKKATIAYGQSGTGKTATVHALANDLNYEILEVNASDFRNKDIINSVIGTAINQRSLFFKGKIILVDEIDGLSGMKDRGGVSALAKLISDSPVPIIMTSDNPYEKKLSDLRKKSELVQFRTLAYTTIFNVLKSIADEEKIKYKEEELKTLARRAGGDLRAAINDLQSLTQDGKLTKEDLEQLSDREKKESIISALTKVFKTTDPSIAIKAYNNVEEDLNKINLWVDENLPKEYTKPQDLARAYDFISKADVMNRRIKRWQHWRFLVYINAYLSAGIAVSKDEKYKGFVSYKPTTRILKLWQAKMKYMKRTSIASKIAEKTHSSTKRAIKDTLPYLKPIFKNKKMGGQLAEELDLNEEELEWLKK
jgi:replication factor C large subunit